MKNYSAYLFDLDGTLVNSEQFKGLALSQACNKFGGKVDVINYKKVMGESWTVVTDYFFNIAKISPDLNEFNLVFNDIYRELISKKIKLNPNAGKLLYKLKMQNKKIGVVSSANKWMVEKILKQLGISKHFDLVLAQEDVTNHKPDPEVYLLALKKLSLNSSEVLIFEDSSAGLIAAKNAGCDAIAIKHEFNVKHDFKIADKVIFNFNEIIF